MPRYMPLAVILLLFGRAPAADLTWHPWSDDIFATAKREHRLVLLDLEAVWCHWCHVMDETTYRDPVVVRLLSDKYLLVRVDQDSRPDLSNRYEDYGWPATIVFDGDGREIVKRSGYLEPKIMASMLQAIIDDPTPGPSVQPEVAIEGAAATSLSAERREKLIGIFRESYDAEHGAWGFVHKYLDADCVEYSLLRAASGDAEAERMARASLAAATALFDPAWGGVYQYSTGGVWNEPHFEKIMSYQADYLRAYALAYAQWREPAHAQACAEVRRFLRGYLTAPEGAFYVSQDADLVQGEHSADYFALGDAARRARGVPRVDEHIYTRENGWAIAALAACYAATGDQTALDEAERAARWIAAKRTVRPSGGFSHDAVDAAGPFLGDNVAMARAALALHAVTGDRTWLAVAEQAMGFIADHFSAAGDNAIGAPAGFLTTAAIPGGLPPTAQRDENIAVARVANLLHHYTGKTAYRAMAEQAFRYLASPGIAERRPTAGVLVADAELSAAPLHITVVGAKNDARAIALFRAAIAVPVVYKRVEWLDPREGKLPNPDVELPTLAEPAAFLCVAGRCSSPASTPAQLSERVNQARARR